MKNLETENLNKLEDLLGQMEMMKKLVGLTITESFEFRFESLGQGEVKENYVKAQIMIQGIFELLIYQTKELREFIEGTSAEIEIT